ncbi:tolloid-like protein 2 [Oculina patagonica]
MLVWLKERGTKTRKGEENGHRRPFTPKAYATNTERCPVQFYKLFRSHRPDEMNEQDAPFFLAVRHGDRRVNPEVWYMKAPLGKNEIGKFLKTAADKASLQGQTLVNTGSRCDVQTQTIDLSYTQNGSIYSPGYPKNYSNYESCRWQIEATYGERVLIYFTAFDLEDDAQCSKDSVQMFDGENSHASLLTKSCGSSLPPPVYSSGKYIYMQFTSDGSVSGEGFVAHYKALNRSSGCPRIVPGASAGVIYSPNFPWNYPKNISCDWLVTAPWGRIINLNFTIFNLESSSNGSCSDYVEVQYDFRTVKYCGSNIPSSITASGSIRVRFYSDLIVTSSGFMALYQTIKSFSTPSLSAASIYDCKPYSQNRIFVKSSSSASISSPKRDVPATSCTFQIDTTEGYILELSFEHMSISSCSSCSCGYINVRDGSSSTAQLLGTFCNENYHGTISSTGNHMYVQYYGHYSWDSFQARVRSKKGRNQLTGAIAFISSLLGVILIGFILLIFYRKKKKHAQENQQRCAQLLESPVTGVSQGNQLPCEPPPPYSSVVADEPPPYWSLATLQSRDT